MPTNPHRFWYSDWGAGLAVRSSENPFPSDTQPTNGHLKHCSFLGSFCPQVLVILLPAQSHCWVVIANVLVWCLAYWSSSCPAFLAKCYRVSWRGKTSSGNLIWQRGGSPSSPLDYEYHLFYPQEAFQDRNHRLPHAKAGQSFGLLLFLVQIAANPLGKSSPSSRSCVCAAVQPLLPSVYSRKPQKFLDPLAGWTWSPKPLAHRWDQAALWNCQPFSFGGCSRGWAKTEGVTKQSKDLFLALKWFPIPGESGEQRGCVPKDLSSALSRGVTLRVDFNQKL